MNHSGHTDAGSPRPNLLVVHCDEMRGMAMGCAGDPNVETPSMDRLAREGVCYTRAYTPDPVCSPARSSMLTGLLPHNTGVWKNNLHLRDDVPTIAEETRAAGYATGHIGKWHVYGGFCNSAETHYQHVPRDGHRGFDYWAGYEHGHNYWKGCYYTADGQKHGYPQGTYEPDGQTDLAIEFVKRNRGNLWHLDLGWGTPHFPLDQVKAEDLARHPEEKVLLRGNVPEIHQQQARRNLAGYYAMIENLDWNLGRLLDSLDAAGVAENTLVVFTSDHGDMMLSHGCNWKRRPYEESIHIPLLMRWPAALPRGRRDASLVSLVDLVPTIRTLIGLPARRTDGFDHTPRLRGTHDAPCQHSVFLGCHWLGCREQDQEPQIRQPWRGVRTDRYTACYLLSETNTLHCVQLYDNDRDPFQLHNIANTDVAAPVRRITDREMLRWMEQTSARADVGATPKNWKTEG